MARAAISRGTSAVIADVEQFKCAICQDIFENPQMLPCNHSFCKDCVHHLVSADPNSSFDCPLCKTSCTKVQISANDGLRMQLITNRGLCDGCMRNFFLNEFRKHKAICEKLHPTAIPIFEPVLPTTQSFPRDMPNRHTFMCPYCGEKNLDVQSLVEHCCSKHRRENHAKVCPVCASMPWGDKNLVSGNLLSHLNLRHKFEYDRFVDYEEEEDKVLQEVLQKSLQEK